MCSQIKYTHFSNSCECNALALIGDPVMLQVERIRQRLGQLSGGGILLLGKPASGKSSVLNTFASAIASILKQQAGAGTGKHSFTSSIQPHFPRWEDGPVKWPIVDTPGDIMEVPISAALPFNTLSGCFC
eukprot:jgi/Ulvmu1/11517/UM078_0006.1